jgi:deoxyribodipyrimidine photo-lyase
VDDFQGDDGMRSLLWFRSDLRTRDNPALSRACAMADAGPDGGVVACFAISPGEWREHDAAAVKIDLILRTLRSLRAALAKLNIPLRILRAAKASDVPGAVLKCAQETRCDAVFFNREHEVNELARDAATSKLFEKAGLKAHSYNDQGVLEPGTVRTEGETFFTVYSPFRRKWLKVFATSGVELGLGPPRAQSTIDVTSDEVPETVDGFRSAVPATLWPAGEEAGLARLRDFVSARVRSYKDQRDFPGIDGTSSLSPYLAIGAISARQCLAAAREANGGKLDGGYPGVDTWINEVLWREFYIHVLVGFPRVCRNRAFKPATEKIRWRDDPAGFDAWCKGRTGYPIVDAAQRQLLATGWMHNRLRMISAMFLTKDLLIDWRLGERFFMSHLVDGFLACNNGGWQWSASTGTDAQPYFRIFNPFSQSRKFDPDGSFIRKWVPELRDVEGDVVHDPSEIPALLRSKLDYPAPIVDHAKARERVLEEFKRADALPE